MSRLRRLLTLCLAMCLTLGMQLGGFLITGSVTAAHADAVAPTSASFEISRGMGSPYDIALGPDGNFWFTDPFDQRIGRATPGGRVTMFVDERLGSRNIVAGPDGAMWFTEGNTIGRITTSGKMSFFTSAKITGIARDIVSGPDGALWFTAGAAIGRITTNDDVSLYPFPSGRELGSCGNDPFLSTNPYPPSLTVGPDQAIWFTEPFNNAIDRIDPNTKDITVYQLPLMNQPTKITTGRDGNIWFFNCGSDQVGRLSFTGQPPQGPEVTLYDHPRSTHPGEVNRMIAGPDGAVWLTRSYPGSIERFAADGTLTTFSAVPSGPDVGIDPQGITIGPDAALWFSTVVSIGGSSRLYWTINRITTSGTTSVGIVGNGVGRATSMAVGSDGNVWFANQGHSNIGRIDQSGRVTYFSDPSIVNPSKLLLGPDGAVWFVNTWSIGRINTQGQVTSYVPGEVVSGMAFGPDGNLWITEPANFIRRMTPTGTLLPAFADPSLAEPRAITAGPDGAMWFIDLGNGDQCGDPEDGGCPPDFVYVPPHIGRVTTSGAFSTYGVSSFFRESGFLGESMVSGPDGALWYTFTGQNQPGLWRITTSGVISSISDPNIDHPGQLLVGPDGAFWMTTTHTYFQWFITRVALGGAITEYAAPATVTLLNPSINLLGQIAFSGSGVLWFPAGQDIGSVTFKAH